MPVYRYEGKLYRLDITDPAEAEKTIIDYLDSQKEPVEKPKATFSEAAGNSFLNAALGISTAFGGASKDTLQKSIDEMESLDTSSGMGMAGSVAGKMGVALPAGLAAGLPGVPMGAAMGLGGLGTGLLSGALSSTVSAPAEYQNTKQNILGKTGDEQVATEAGLNAAGWDVAGNLFMGQGGKLARVLKGSAQNVGADIAGSYAHNAILGDEYSKLHKDPLDPKSIALNAAVGGVTGLAFGSRKGERFYAKDEVPTGGTGGKPTDTKPYNDYTDSNANAIPEFPVQQALRERQDVLSHRLDYLNEEIGKFKDNPPATEASQSYFESLTRDQMETSRQLETVQLALAEPSVLETPSVTRTEVPTSDVKTDVDIETPIPASKASTDLSKLDNLPELHTDKYGVNSHYSLTSEGDRNFTRYTHQMLPGRVYEKERDLWDDLRVALEEKKTTNKPFVKGNDYIEVNESVEAKRAVYEALPDDKLDLQIESKKAKIAKAYSDDFRSVLQSELDMLNEIKASRSKGESGNGVDFHKVNPETPKWSQTAQLHQAIETNGLRGGLEFIANMRNDKDLHKFGRYMGELANRLLQNKLIGHALVEYDPTLKGFGGYNNVTGSLVFQNRVSATPGVVLHEVIHSAINKALMLFDIGKLPDKAANDAARNLNRLFRELKTNKSIRNQLDKLTNNQSKIMFENVREMVAYALTDENMARVLSSVKSNGTSVFTKLSNYVKDMFGLVGNERTAMDDILHYSEILMDLSDGSHAGFEPKAGGIYSFSRVHTPSDILRSIRNGSDWIFAHGFTAQLKQWMKDNPTFMQMSNYIDAAERKKESLVIEITMGKDSVETYLNQKRIFGFKLSGPQSETAIVPAMYHLKDEDVAKVFDVFKEGQYKGRSHQESVDIVANTMSEKHKNLAIAIMNAERRLWEESVRMQGRNDLDKMEYMSGHLTTDRVGDWSVNVAIHGVPLKAYRFLTRAEAEHFQKLIQQSDNRLTVGVGDVKNKPNEGNIVDALDRMLKEAPNDGTSLRAYFAKQLDTLERENPNVGGHMIRSDKLGGFTGDQFFLTDAQRGRLIRDALPRAYKSYAENIMARDVQKKWIETQVDKDDFDIDPHTREITSFYVGTQINRIFDEKAMFRNGIATMSRGFRELIDRIPDSIFGFHARDKHAFDRFTGVMGNLFYTFNITMKPAIWIAQPLQALMSSRSAFKDGAGIDTILLATADTIKTLSLGHKHADQQFLRDLYKTAEDGNTLHPQMTNEYNQISFGTNPAAWYNKTLDLGTGKTISAAGDKFSRFASYAFFYNLHKRNGLKGEELRIRAMRDTTENLYAYGQKNLPAIYREMGIFGEQAAPLTTFAHGQLGNLAVDVKEFVGSWHKSWQKKSLDPLYRATMPLIMTGAVTMMLGGAISLPILAEYELIRLAGQSYGMWGDEWPSATDWILRNAPPAIAMGALSDLTGVDMDASMRYTSLFKKITDVSTEGLAVFFPTMSWGKTFIASTAALAAQAIPGTTPMTETEQTKHLKNVIPKGIPSGIVAEMRDDPEKTVTSMGTRGHGGVEKGTAEHIAPFFGSRSTAEAYSSMAAIEQRRQESIRSKQNAKATQLFMDGHTDAAIRILVKNGVPPKQALSQLKAQAEAERTPAHLRGIMGKSGTMTYDQMRKAEEYQLQDVRERIERYKD